MRQLAYCIIAVLLICTSAPFIFAQEDDVLDTEEIKILSLDINTASLQDLATMCTELGLSQAGTLTDLRKRLLAHYKIDSKKDTSSEDAKTVQILSARSTEYINIEVVNEEYARLNGDVVILFTDGKETHRIQADEMLYNKTKNIIHARGNVLYLREGETNTETFRGQALEVNIDTWNGVFVGGTSEKGKKSDDKVYRFTADSITRSEDGVSLLENAIIENAKTEEAYWSLAAKKIWLLPGNDWAIRNATLKVGHIPVLYFPFFFYPGNKIFFNPVFGIRQREGTFLQTSTYLIGQSTAKSSEESSIMQILDSNDDKELKREGLFLVATNRPKKTEGKKLALLFDMYSNLGAYIGLDFSQPKTGIFGATTIDGGFALSRTVRPLGNGQWTTFMHSDSMESEWNQGNFFSFDIPFRYRLKAQGSFVFKRASINWNLPFYSDVYIDKDFMNRSEKMDWFNMMKSGAASLQESEDIGVLGNYNWRVSASGLRSDTKILSPYVQGINFSTLSSTLSFNSKTDPTLSSSYSPMRTFFYPSSLNLLTLNVSTQGKPLSLPFKKTEANKTEVLPEQKKEIYEIESSSKSPFKPDVDEAKESIIKKPLELSPPSLEQGFAIDAASGSTAEVSYSLSASWVSDLLFNSEIWKSNTDIDWNDIASFLNVAKINPSLSAKFSLPQSTFSGSFLLAGSGTWQDYLFFDETASKFDTETKRENEAIRNYKATGFNTTADISFAGKPLVLNPIFSASSLNYSFKTLLAKSEFSGTPQEPNWDIITAEWDKESIQTHSIGLNLYALLYEKNQNFSLFFTLPPLDSKASGKLNFNYWKASTAASMDIEDFETENRIFKPLTLEQKINIDTKKYLSQSLIIDVENSEFLRANTAIHINNLSFNFSAEKTNTYFFNEATGWVLDRESEELRPKSLSVIYGLNKEFNNLWHKRLHAGIRADSTLSFDLLRYTQSFFRFNLTTSLKINDFLEWSFSSVSQNSVLFRYLQDLPFVDLPFRISGEPNIALDLLQSFYFWDKPARINSGFKLKSLSTTLKHFMGDWTASLSYTVVPVLYREKKMYEFENEISFLVQWIPFNEFKVETYRDKDGLIFK